MTEPDPATRPPSDAWLEPGDDPRDTGQPTPLGERGLFWTTCATTG